MSKSLELYTRAFMNPRDKRSEEYKEGVRDALRFKLGESKFIRCKYVMGTCRADAWFSGCDEGYRIARDYQEKVGAGGTDKSK
ncbi:MAG TPA: hypothetical protein VJ001_14610 [Rhodocyclaceae bacterium]|nr:hypothetical protein [Rhodocyclaceae bacterium]